jgi:hypothetical protein
MRRFKADFYNRIRERAMMNSHVMVELVSSAPATSFSGAGSAGHVRF